MRLSTGLAYRPYLPSAPLLSSAIAIAAAIGLVVIMGLVLEALLQVWAVQLVSTTLLALFTD